MTTRKLCTHSQCRHAYAAERADEYDWTKDAHTNWAATQISDGQKVPCRRTPQQAWQSFFATVGGLTCFALALWGSLWILGHLVAPGGPDFGDIAQP